MLDWYLLKFPPVFLLIVIIEKYTGKKIFAHLGELHLSKAALLVIGGNILRDRTFSAININILIKIYWCLGSNYVQINYSNTITFSSMGMSEELSLLVGLLRFELINVFKRLLQYSYFWLRQLLKLNLPAISFERVSLFMEFMFVF